MKSAYFQRSIVSF